MKHSLSALCSLFALGTALSAQGQTQELTAPQANAPKRIIAQSPKSIKKESLQLALNAPANRNSAVFNRARGTRQEGEAEAETISNDILRARFNTVSGPAGLIAVPNAYVATKNRVVFGMTLGRDKSASANYGITESVDVGAAVLDLPGSEIRTLVNAKVNIVPKNFRSFEIGIGIIDAADSVNRTGYIMASADWATPEILKKSFVGLRLHAGFGSGIFRERFIGGAELLFSKRMAIVGDYDGSRANVALRYIRDESFRAQIGLYRDNLFVSASYAFTP